MKVAVIGATGLVGSKMLQVLQERQFPVSKLIPAAGEKSAGQKIHFNNVAYPVITCREALLQRPDIALFSAGAEVSRQWAPQFAENGCYVIDNSSAWRMEKDIPLIVPEINASILQKRHRLIANPNCSTIQLVMAAGPLHNRFGIKRMIISTYQSVTGTGIKGIRQLDDEENGVSGAKAYPHQIYRNCLPHCDVFLDNGYTREEMKLVNETHKILGDNSIAITATAVRVPVTGGHSESVWLEFERDFRIEEVYETLSGKEGVVILDNPAENLYPVPLYAERRNEVFVGRIRRDLFDPRSLNLWIVADNLRKGAATNAVQIAEHIVLNSFRAP
ncbi:MAG: aspartate-semialdehyde dehydrogenase [Bacteroidetes bacterium]|nr:aspartate-semialdehyde dehydrogenase [Bacteroidota bacterium]